MAMNLSSSAICCPLGQDVFSEPRAGCYGGTGQTVGRGERPAFRLRVLCVLQGLTVGRALRVLTAG